eukprot:g727.t1
MYSYAFYSVVVVCMLSETFRTFTVASNLQPLKEGPQRDRVRSHRDDRSLRFESMMEDMTAACVLKCGQEANPKTCGNAKSPTPVGTGLGCCPLEGWTGEVHCSGHGECNIPDIEPETFIELTDGESVKGPYDYSLSPKEMIESLSNKIYTFLDAVYGKNKMKCKLSLKKGSKECKKDVTYGCGCTSPDCLLPSLNFWVADDCAGTFKLDGAEMSCGEETLVKDDTETSAVVDPSSAPDKRVNGCDVQRAMSLNCFAGRGQYDPTWDYAKGYVSTDFKKTRPPDAPIVKALSVTSVGACRTKCIAEHDCVAFDIMVDLSSPTEKPCRLYRKNVPRPLKTGVFYEPGDPNPTAVAWAYCALDPEVRNTAYRCGKTKTKECVTPMCQCEDGFSGFGCEIDESKVGQATSPLDPAVLLPERIEPTPCLGDVSDFMFDDPCADPTEERVPWPPPEDPPGTIGPDEIDEKLAYKSHKTIEAWKPPEDEEAESDNDEGGEE